MDQLCATCRVPNGYQRYNASEHSEAKDVFPSGLGVETKNRAKRTVNNALV